MSQQLVPEDVLSQLTPVLAQLSNADNTIRSQAEQRLNDHWVAHQPDVLLLGLAQLINSPAQPDIQSFSSVLLRRIAFRVLTAGKEETTLWMAVAEGTRQQVKNALLYSLSAETNAGVRHKVCDTIAEVAKSEEHAWQELLNSLFECTKSPSPSHRESAFRIFSSVPHLISNQHTDAVKGVFATSLADESKEVRLAALKAAVQFLLATQTTSREVAAELMPLMLNVLTPLAAQKEEDHLFDALTTVIDLAENLPRLFRPVLSELIPFMVNIMKEKSFEDRTRQTALELLVSLAEANPAMMRKAADFCQQIVPVALEMMTDMEEDESWFTTDDLEEDDNDENYAIGEQAMDRLARSLGGKSVLPVTFQYIPQMLGSQQWQQRHAALMAISAIGEGCVKIMEAELGKVIELVLPYLRDPHARVRWAACNAIGQMSTDFAPTMQKLYHSQVLSGLVPVMDDAINPRVQAHSAAAMVNFCEAADKAVLSPYLDAIFERLLLLLNNTKTYVQEQAITTIATVADSAEDAFVRYYDRIMPLLINVLRQTAPTQYRLLRGKAMECATLIALAVGKEVFAPNASDFIDLLVQTQQSITEADDPQISYLLGAWARVCKVLGTDFVPYLPVVMPPLLKSAQLKPDFAILDGEEDEARYAEEDGWEFVGVDGQQIGIRTTVLEEKCTATEMLICYAKELGAGFQPYVETVLEIVLPLLKFYFHDGVRHAAAAVIPLLLQDAKLAGQSREYLLAMWHTICTRLVEVIASEADPSFLLQVYSCFHESLEVLAEQCMTPEEMAAFTRHSEAQLKDLLERLQQHAATRQSADYDAEDEENLLEEEANEEMVLGELSKALHTILRTHRDAYLPHFETLIPMLSGMLSHPIPAARQFAVCVWDDIVEFTSASSNYQAHFVEKLVGALLDPAADVRQAAAYGMGVCAQFGGEQYGDVCAAALNPLFQLINSPEARTEDNIYVTENAIAAVGKVCRFGAHKFNVDEVLPSWFAALPILNDREEAPVTYAYLLDLFDAQHPAILGPNGANVPRLVEIFTDVLAEGVLGVDQEIGARMVATLKTLLGNIPQEIKDKLWNAMTPEKRKALQKFI
ncbi:uncharacterized protein VTP21DRAFT_3428 [Calcarisporiella thermophila]|uniref:uncharacterized protein n=1 Tax=Calcarisporiella thermophila TaxID=911321 RepID=UPI003742F937